MRSTTVGPSPASDTLRTRVDREAGRRQRRRRCPPVAQSAKPSAARLARPSTTAAGLSLVADGEERRACRSAAAARPPARPWRTPSGSRPRVAMTSPVERISGPEHRRRRPGSGRRGRRTPSRRHAPAAHRPATRPARTSCAPAASRQAASTRLTPSALDANGTVREARGFASRTKRRPSCERQLHVDEPDDPERRREARDGLGALVEHLRRGARPAGARRRSRPSGRRPPRRAP